MKKEFLNIKIGDEVIAFDEYSHDYVEHVIKVESIEYEKDYITDTNPKGMHCFGTDLQEDEWGDEYITHIHEENFIGIVEEKEKLHVCSHCLQAIESREGPQITRKHYIDSDDLEHSKCEWCEQYGFAEIYELI